MQSLQCDKSNMASIILAKGVLTPLRGQPNLIVQIPFGEWYKFVQENVDYLRSRQPLQYDLMLNSGNPTRAYKFYMFDCSWALFNELNTSANCGLNSSLIFPYFNDGKAISVGDILERARAMSDEDFARMYNKMMNATPHCPIVPINVLTPWNYNVLQICVYLQSMIYNERQEKVNIDWR